jgi:hypothetical protein
VSLSHRCCGRLAGARLQRDAWGNCLGCQAACLVNRPSLGLLAVVQAWPAEADHLYLLPQEGVGTGIMPGSLPGTYLELDL